MVFCVASNGVELGEPAALAHRAPRAPAGPSVLHHRRPRPSAALVGHRSARSEFAATHQKPAYGDVCGSSAAPLRSPSSSPARRGILELASDTPIVMLSGFGADGVMRELIQAGATAYRRKGLRSARERNRRSRGPTPRAGGRDRSRRYEVPSGGLSISP